MLGKQAVRFCLLALTTAAVNAAGASAEVDGSSRGNENSTLVSNGFDDQPLILNDVEDYEAIVIDREAQEVRKGCETCHPWFIQFCVPGNTRCGKVASTWAEFHSRY